MSTQLSARPEHRISPLVPHFSTRACALGLGVIATGASVAVAIIAGRERGGTWLEQLVWIAVGVALLLAAHFLPALTRGTSWRLRLPAMGVWCVTMLATGYGHATFFLDAQQHAGKARAAAELHAVSVSPDTLPEGRRPSAIAFDRAKVQGALAALSAARCIEPCVGVQARQSALDARLSALNIELAEAKRREVLEDQTRARRAHLDAQREAAQQDPVTGPLAQLLDVSNTSVDLALALALGFLLEAIACLAWFIALSSAVVTEVARDDATEEVAPSSRERVAAFTQQFFESNRVTVMSSAAVALGNGRHAQATVTVTDEDREVASGVHRAELLRLLEGVEAGLTRATVADIRRYFSCSQAKAVQLRRAFCEVPQEIGATNLVS